MMRTRAHEGVGNRCLHVSVSAKDLHDETEADTTATPAQSALALDAAADAATATTTDAEGPTRATRPDMRVGKVFNGLQLGENDGFASCSLEHVSRTYTKRLRHLTASLRAAATVACYEWERGRPIGAAAAHLTPPGDRIELTRNEGKTRHEP